MATGEKDDVGQVAPEEVYDATKGAAKSSVVGVEGVEDAQPGDDTPTDKATEEMTSAQTKETPPPPSVHETPSVKTTVTEDTSKPSIKDKIKGKVGQVADKLRPKAAVEAKSADPHPELVD